MAGVSTWATKLPPPPTFVHTRAVLSCPAPADICATDTRAKSDSNGLQGKMLKRWIAVVVVWCGAPAAAIAQPVMLTCTGTMVQFSPERIEGNVSPTSAALDLDQRTLRVFGGTYDITDIRETELVLSGKSAELVFFGTVDRTAGTIGIMAMRPEERAKLNSGKPSQMSMNMNLTCSPAKQRMF
ncbi:hypothetical protein ACVWWK_002265 [Bradyrhizobium sp. LB9.1b]